jgi:hypothetical protein
VRALAGLVVVVACGGGAAPDPARRRDQAVAACTAAIDDVAAALVNQKQPLSALASGLANRVTCADLYQNVCAQAWRALATPTPYPPAAQLATTVKACAHKYCAELAEPRPRGCEPSIRLAIDDDGDGAAAAEVLEELDRRILAHEGVSSPVATAIARRAQLFKTLRLEKIVTMPGRPVDIGAPPPPMLEIRVTATTVAIEGTVVDDAQLRDAITVAVALDPNVAVKITPDADVQHARVVAIMDVAKAAGVTKIALGIP